MKHEYYNVIFYKLNKNQPTQYVYYIDVLL